MGTWHFVKKQLRKIHGGILLEFAFAVPVLIMSLYFILDVPHIYRLSSRLHKLSELYSQCMLNTVNIRESKELTSDDLKNISRGIGLSITGVLGNTKYPYTLSTYVHCVKGTSSGFTIGWTIHIQNKLGTASDNLTVDTTTTYSDVTAANLPGDWSDFKISNGEHKIVVETVIWTTEEGGLKKLFYLLPLVGKKFGNQISTFTPVEGMKIKTNSSLTCNW